MDITGGNTTSFIPKKPLVVRSDFSASFGGIFMAISVILFIASVSGYFIASYQKKTKADDIKFLTDNLQKAQAQFQPNQVLNMTRFDTKLQVAQDLLYLNKNAGFADTTMHITLQPLFKILSDKTLTLVRFKDFKYTNVDNQKIEIKMSGEAKGRGNIANYAAVAQQAREFADTRSLANVIVSDLNLGSNNNVIFNLSASVKPELISYTESLKQ
jgi:hypothetical protein